MTVKYLYMAKSCIRLFIIAALLFIFNLPIDSYGANKIRIFDSDSGPYLIYPATEDITLKGKDFLEFRWEKTGGIRLDHFEFKLYKGYETIASTLIFKQNFPRDVYPIRIPAKLFENNQVYTWSLRQAFMNGEKTSRSFSSFKVIEK